MTAGIKVSKEGYDISSTSPDDFILNSEYGSVKIYREGSGTLTISSGTNHHTLTISHQLGFVPMCMIYTELTPGSGRWFMGCTFSPLETFYLNPDANYTYVDGSVLSISYWHFGGGNLSSNQTISYHYYILGNTAQ